jgi:hypothetical protein
LKHLSRRFPAGSIQVSTLKCWIISKNCHVHVGLLNTNVWLFIIIVAYI